MSKLSPDGVVEEFQLRWRTSDLRDKMPEPMVVANGPVVELTLIAVHRAYQSQGCASRALEMLANLCDENGITLRLVARRMDDSSVAAFAPGCPAGLSTENLIAWYKRHGFLDIAPPGDDTHTLERKPGPSRAAATD